MSTPARPSALAAHARALSARLGGQQVLCGVSLELRAGELCALVGCNGSGKSTLLGALTGRVPLQGGEVTLGGSPLAALGARARAARVAWLPQHPPSVEGLTAVEVVETGRFRFAEGKEALRREALRALERVGVAPLAQRRFEQLSGGERQRVLVASLLAQQAPLLLVDEAANHLDPAQQLELYALFGELVREGLAILSVTHDPSLLHFSDAPTRVCGLQAGRLQFDLPLTDPALGQHLGLLYGVRVESLVRAGGRPLWALERLP